MDEKDLRYGAHSGIQKAIRRGNLDLAFTSFELMWEEKFHRNWLKWRMPILVEEEAWYLLGEFAEFIKDKPEGKKEWKKFIYTLTIGIKSKDTEGLWRSAKEGLGDQNHTEIILMKQWLDEIDKRGGEPGEVAEDLWKWCLEQRSFSDYEKGALDLMKLRLNQGGMLGDRFCCTAAMILIATRGLKKEEVQKRINKDFEQWKKDFGKSPKKIDFPWWIFDMHTAKGKWALNIFAKKYCGKGKKYPNFERDDIKLLWFCNVSGHIPSTLIKVAKVKKDSSCFDTMWWIYVLKFKLTMGGNTPERNIKLWKEEIKDLIHNLVEWCLKK